MGVRRAEIINGLRWSVVADALGLPAENRQRGNLSVNYGNGRK